MTIYITGFFLYYIVEVSVLNESIIKGIKRFDRRKNMLIAQLKFSFRTALFWPYYTVEAVVALWNAYRKNN